MKFLRIRSMSLLVVCFLLWAGGAHSQDIVPDTPHSWLVFLCRASDDATEPHAPVHYQRLFNPADPDMLDAYFRETSFGKVRVHGSRVFGWFKMESSAVVLGGRSRDTRHLTVSECRDAAVKALTDQGRAIDTSQWQGIIAIINVGTDAGATGNNIVGNQGEVVAFFQHEMIHAMGLGDRHSHNLPNDTSADHTYGKPQASEYDDPWDIMSFNTNQWSYNPIGGTNGFAGPSLNMAYRAFLGWAPPDRIVTQRVRSDGDRGVIEVTLTPVSESFRPGPLAAVIDLPKQIRYFVEYRRAAGYDKAIPRNEVVVREWRHGDDETYLVRQINGHVGFVPGEPYFTDAANFLSVIVKALSENGRNAVISIDTSFGLNTQMCTSACAKERDTCRRNTQIPGNPSVRECIQQHGSCVRACRP